MFAQPMELLKLKRIFGFVIVQCLLRTFTLTNTPGRTFSDSTRKRKTQKNGEKLRVIVSFRLSKLDRNKSDDNVCHKFLCSPSMLTKFEFRARNKRWKPYG